MFVDLDRDCLEHHGIVKRLHNRRPESDERPQTRSNKNLTYAGRFRGGVRFQLHGQKLAWGRRVDDECLLVTGADF